MKPRAWVDNDFYYAKSDEAEDMIEFWSIVRGYELKGKEVIIDHFSGVTDIDGVEVYSGDTVELYFNKKSESIKFIRTQNPEFIPYDVEEGYVDFVDCCFVILNDITGLIWDVGNFFMENESFSVKITGHIYEDEDDEEQI